MTINHVACGTRTMPPHSVDIACITTRTSTGLLGPTTLPSLCVCTQSPAQREHDKRPYSRDRAFASGTRPCGSVPQATCGVAGESGRKRCQTNARTSTSGLRAGVAHDTPAVMVGREPSPFAARRKQETGHAKPARAASRVSHKTPLQQAGAKTEHIRPCTLRAGSPEPVVARHRARPWFQRPLGSGRRCAAPARDVRLAGTGVAPLPPAVRLGGTALRRSACDGGAVAACVPCQCVVAWGGRVAAARARCIGGDLSPACHRRSRSVREHERSPQGQCAGHALAKCRPQIAGPDFMSDEAPRAAAHCNQAEPGKASTTSAYRALESARATSAQSLQPHSK